MIVEGKPKQNISLIDEITLNYEGICNIKTKNQFNAQSLRYRSIDVKEPFPTGIIPTNWKEWYQDPTKQQRIATTYDKEMIYAEFIIQ